ncbi:MAG: hypothetical protein ACHP7N_04880 [Caulobacterales bacterium]
MPALPLPQFAFLVGVIAAFVAFIVTLFSVYIHVNAESANAAAQAPEREVTPARRAPATPVPHH